MQRRRALNVELLTQSKWSILIGQIPPKMGKITQKIALSHIFLDILSPRVLLAVYTEFRCHGKWGIGTKLRMCSGLDHTILNVTFSVIVHTVVLHLLLAVSICNL